MARPERRRIERPIELGDFPTPLPLARRICRLLADRGAAPASIVEPTCGAGNLLIAALERFPGAKRAVGVEIQADHVRALSGALRARGLEGRTTIHRASFFDIDWAGTIGDLPEPVLVLGNPPWATNSAIGAAGGANLPPKSNFQKRRGLEALTGKSNFDLSESMFVALIGALDGRAATLAMLCKTAVARKALLHAWKNDVGLSGAEARSIDAAEHFQASVDACLLLCEFSPSGRSRDCRAYRRFDDEAPGAVFGHRDGALVADVSAAERWRHLAAGDGPSRWRSGVKHDCARVMELRNEDGRFRNGLNELVDLEPDHLYPMLKSSDVARGRAIAPTRWMLVTQRDLRDDTSRLQSSAPKTWAYLQKHGELLDRRASSIYRGRPRFAVFGTGGYTFAPWKVAVSGFYPGLRFHVVGRFEGKPIVLDDTCYFLACATRAEAERTAGLLNSPTARAFYSAWIFERAKRPITIEILRRLDLAALEHELAERAS